MRSAALAVLVVATATITGAALSGVLGLEEIVMMYLLAILIVALRTDRVGATVASLASVAAFDFFFVPPLYSFGVKDVRHLLTFAVMFTVGLVVSTLTLRARKARAEELRSAILSSVSHDFRTPLSIITGAASALRTGGNLDGAARRTLVDSICEEADRLERLLSKILAMTKVEAGLAPVTEPVPIEEPLGTALTRLEARLADHVVDIAVPESLPFVSCDPVLLEQVFLNLVENFARHTPPGTTLRVSASVDGARLSVDLEDDGPGLPDEVRRRTFQKFNKGSPRGDAGQGPPERWLRYGLQRVLPGLVANADREELTMTALGAGTALSTLHTLRRAVLVLHGHKHYATARHLRRTVRDHGDVIVASAGSAGSAERWSPAGTTDFARLWPSLNAVSLEGRDLSIETVSFGYKGAKVGRVVTTPLLRATRDEARWETTPIKTEGRGPSGPELELNESRCTLVRTLGHRGGRWDVLYERRLRRSGDSPHRYLEHVEGAPGSMLEIGAADDLPVPSPGPVELTLEGEGVTRYRLVAGVCRTIEEAELVYGSRTAPYEWIGLMNRYACQRATLSITGLGNRSSDCFASITDLGTGLEEPLRANPSEAGDSVAVTVAPCAPRALLRIYWPLEARGR